MKKIKTFGFIFLFLLIIFSNMSIAFADTDYVGVKENEIYTWKVSFDEKAIEDIIDDGEEYFPDTSDDLYEENDDFYSAATIHEGDHFNLNCSDDDWFNVSLNIRDEINFYAIPSYPTPTLKLELYTDNQVLINKSEFISIYEHIKFTANYTGAVYLRVYLETPGENLYSLHVDIEEAPPLPPPPIDYKEFIEEIFEDYYDYEGLRVEIEKIGTEKEFDKEDVEKYLTVDPDIDDYNGVKVHVKFSKTKHFNDEDRWKKESDIKEIVIVDPKEGDYYKFILSGLGLIIAQGVDWNELVDDLEKDFNNEEDDIEEFFDDDNIEIEANVEFNGARIKITTDDNDISDFEVILRYHSNGVLEYYEVKYGEVQIAYVELQGIIPDHIVTIGSIAAIIGGAGIVAIVMIYKKYHT